MNQEQLIQNESTYDLTTFDILSNGNLIDPSYQVLSIMVENTANKIPVARIVIRDGEAAEGKFEISDAPVFEPGAKIEIKAGLDGDNETIFSGIALKQKVKVVENGTSFLYVECRDEVFKLTLGRKNKYFEDSRDSDVISNILGGFAGEVESTSVQHKELIQHYVSDWDFVMCRAEINGKLVFVEQGKINVKAPKTSGNSSIALAFGGNLLEFEAEMDARTQWKKVKASSWDYASQAYFESDSSSAKFDEVGDISGEDLSKVGSLEEYELMHGGQVLQDELQAWADACMLKSRLAKTRGRARFIDFVFLKPGQLADISGVGNHFNGKVYITGVRYELIKGTCYTDIQFGLPPNWFYQENDILETPASGLVAAISGLQVGKVVQLEGDPDGEDRILVKLPTIDFSAQGTWMRMASLDAGQNRGWIMRPEIDDEVIVGFINADPRDAIVLGMLHSSAKPAPIPAKDDNHIKGYTSRSEMKLEFDDQKKIITIETPAGNSIIIDEEGKEISIVDQNNNEYRMNTAGISMKSPKDIKIEAAGSIDIKATGDLSMEGLNLSGKAAAQLKVEGGAAAELSSGGATTIKGSMVMLN